MTIVMKELSYATTNDVMTSWEALRHIKDYETVAGKVLYQKLFAKSDDAKALFGFSKNADPYSSEVYESRKFKTHSVYLIQMLDASLNLLGPDSELLGSILTDLGEKHITFGVTAEFFPIMGVCLMETLKELLKPDVFTDAVREAWVETYNAMTQVMIAAQIAKKR